MTAGYVSQARWSFLSVYLSWVPGIFCMEPQLLLSSTRQLYPLLALAWLLLVWKRRSPLLLLLGVLAANAWVWAVTNLPLQRLYALGPSRDRVNNVGMVQVVAAGNSALETVHEGQMHFEPFWGALVAALSGWDPERVLNLYPYFSLAVVLAFALSLYRGLACMRGGLGTPWARALVAGFATLLCSSPLDYLGHHSVPWAMMFLLKPNHALGLVLLPLVLWAVAETRGWWGRLGAGFLLHLLGWAFVIHMGFTAIGLVVFAGLSLLARGPRWRRDLLDVAGTIGLNLVIVSPYLYMLFADYPFMKPNVRAVLPADVPHFMEATLKPGWLFVLGLWGAWRAYSRGGRLGVLWASQFLGALAVWAAYPLLSAFQMAREQDEIYQWMRFLTAVLAGWGAWDIAGRASVWLHRRPRPRLRVLAVTLAVLPATLPYWWDPLLMDRYFSGSLEPLPEQVTVPCEYLRHYSRPGDVVAGDRLYAPWVSAVGARRVLLSGHMHVPPGHRERRRLEQDLVRGSNRAEARKLRRRYRVRHLLATLPLLKSYGTTLAQLRARPDLKELRYVRIDRKAFVSLFLLRPGDWP